MSCRASTPASLLKTGITVLAVHLAAGLLEEHHPVARGAADAAGIAVVQDEAIAAVAGQLLGAALQLVPGLRRFLEARPARDAPC